LRNTLATLQTLRPVWVFRTITGSAPAASDSFDNNTCDTQKKDCDKGHDNGGHDHGNKDCGCDHGHR
jgi:hypothetical protein